jgi:hypothetical protein
VENEPQIYSPEHLLLTNSSNNSLKLISIKTSASSKMHFLDVLALASTLLTTTSAVSIRFHALNHCNSSPIDLACANLPQNACCAKPGLNARSVTFLHGKGDIGHVGGKNCGTTYKAQLKGPNWCIFHTGPKGVYHSAHWNNPLSVRDSMSARETCCAQTLAPDQAIVNGNVTFNIKDMTAAQVDKLTQLAEGNARVGDYPSDLSKFIVDTEDW